MNVPSFVGPLVSTILFLLTVFGLCFYYCYWKPKRQRKKSEECASSTSSNSGHSRSLAKTTTSCDEDYYYGFSSGLSTYSAGYCFHGGFPMVNACSEQRWQPTKMKYQTPYTKVSKIDQCKKPKACCELRVEVIKERTPAKPCVSRQFSTESGGVRHVCHLQAIQECEEEKEESEQCCQVNNRDVETDEFNIVST